MNNIAKVRVKILEDLLTIFYLMIRQVLDVLVNEVSSVDQGQVGLIRGGNWKFDREKFIIAS